MASSTQRLLITERPFYRQGGSAWFLDREDPNGYAPRTGDVVTTSAEMTPDDEGDLLVEDVRGVPWFISTEALAEVI